jgi:hypothetical protein
MIIEKKYIVTCTKCGKQFKTHTPLKRVCSQCKSPKKKYPYKYLETSMYDVKRDEIGTRLLIIKTKLTKKERRGIKGFIEKALEQQLKIIDKKMKKPYYDATWIKSLESRMLWNYYWMQQKIMEPFLQVDHALIEMGVGSGFCSNYLKSRGYKIQTIDIDAEKRPDVVCDATNWKPEKVFNGFLAFQVFEHMPFVTFEKTIQNVSKSKIEYLYVSVPDNKMSKKILFRGNIYLAKFGNFNLDIRWPFWGKAPISNKAHLWELGDGNITLQKYYDVYLNAGYKMLDSQKVSYAQFNVFQLK